MGLENIDKSKWTQVQLLQLVREYEAEKKAKKKIFAEAEKISMERHLTDDELYTKVIDLKGHKHQLNKCIEEMSELIKELCKFVNDDYYNMDKIIEEHADVTIMLRQLEIIMGRTGYKYKGMLKNGIDYKNARLERRLESVETKTYEYVD
jgi:hypothetical protein